MVKKIIHIADLHIRTIQMHDLYREQFEKLENSNYILNVLSTNTKEKYAKYKKNDNEIITEKDIELRYNLMNEENSEYLEAAKNGDIVEVADALGDQLYILCGTILKHGLQHKIVEVFTEIQRSNMSKLDINGKPIYREDGKVLKSSLYFRPNIKAILEK